MPFWKKQNLPPSMPAVMTDPVIARKSLTSRGVPDTVLDAIEQREPPFVYLSWAKPDFARANALAQVVPGLAGLCPIAEENGEAVIGVLPHRDAYIRYYYEDGRQGNAGITVFARGYTQFAASILLSLAESGLRQQLIEAAALLDFKELPTLLSLLDADPYDDEAVEEFFRHLGSAA